MQSTMFIKPNGEDDWVVMKTTTEFTSWHEYNSEQEIPI